jgi:hypothetical protein
VSPGRYDDVGQAVWTAPDGTGVPYLRRRLLPTADAIVSIQVHDVRLGERVDTIAALELGDPTLSWRLADANLAMRPTELSVPGRVLTVPLPPGVPGPARGQ